MRLLATCFGDAPHKLASFAQQLLRTSLQAGKRILTQQTQRGEPMNAHMLMRVATLLALGAVAATAQDTSRVRVPVRKDTIPRAAAGTVVQPADSLAMEWYTPTGTTCSTVDVSAAKAVAIKSDLYKADSGMISPDSAKVLALCAVPGQIGSGEMNMADGRTEYAIDIIPNQKKTHTKVVIDAKTGAVLSSKQFGGLRGLAGWVRESAEHKTNTKRDTIP
jgi:uncharacterized membrane protein YkoI